MRQRQSKGSFCSMNNFSLYLHLPFCAKKCRYCDFYSVPYEKASADTYLDALEREIGLSTKSGLLDGAMVRTLFMGGGSPSVISPDQLRALCACVRGAFTLEADLEWTVECNPESFTHEKAAALLENGVNRLTFGMQSFDDRELGLLGRVHNAARCRELLSDPMLGRFASIGVDLMYGLPGQTLATLEGSLRAVLESPYVKHVSAYELTIAEGTPFGRHRSLLPRPDDDTIAAMTERLWRLLGENGFDHYEVSNFAQPGHRCHHNEAYWDHAPYLGLGCAAHSYFHPKRWANVKDLDHYGAMIAAGRFPREFEEELDTAKLAEEMLFLGLRRSAGINKVTFKENCGIEFSEFANTEKIAEFIRKGLLIENGPIFMPTERGMLFADAMARELL
jgi:oxygen-independent coproporphyrinogen-3 oxidase